MFGAALGGILGGVLSGGIGAIGAGRASRAQQEAARRARRTFNHAMERNADTIEGGTEWRNNATENAWRTNYRTSNALRRTGRDLFGGAAQMGNNALQAYASNLGLGQAPEGYSLAMSPAAQFQMQQGREMIEGGAAGAGGLYSGATLEALQDRGQGIAAQDFNNQQGQLFNLGGVGQQATQNLYGVERDWANNLIGGSAARTDRLTGTANDRTNALTGQRNIWANGVANSYMAQGQAQANGAIGTSNALLGGISNGLGLYGMMGGRLGSY